MIRYLIFLILTIPFFIKRIKNATSQNEKIYLTINYLIVFFLAEYFISAFLVYFRPLINTGFDSFELNSINYIDKVYYKIFIICYLTLTFIMTGISIGLVFLRNKFRKQFFYSLPAVWILLSLRISLLFIEEYNEFNISHLRILITALIMFAIFELLIFLIYSLKGMKKIFI